MPRPRPAGAARGVAGAPVDLLARGGDRRAGARRPADRRRRRRRDLRDRRRSRSRLARRGLAGRAGAAAGRGRAPGARVAARGLRFLVQQPVILGTFVLDTNAMVFGMPQALFPAVAAHHFDGGAGSSAACTPRRRSARWSPRSPRAGSAARPPPGRRGRASAIVLWGVAIAGFGFSTALWLGLVAARRRRPRGRVQRDPPLDDPLRRARPTRCAAACRASSSPRSRARPRSATSRPASSPR